MLKLYVPKAYCTLRNRTGDYSSAIIPDGEIEITGWLDGWLNVLLVICSNDLIVGFFDFGWRDGWMYMVFVGYLFRSSFWMVADGWKGSDGPLAGCLTGWMMG